MNSEPTPTPEKPEPPGELPIVARGVAGSEDYRRAASLFLLHKTSRLKGLGQLALLLGIAGMIVYLSVTGNLHVATTIVMVVIYIVALACLEFIVKARMIDRPFDYVQNPPRWEFSSTGVKLERNHELSTWTWSAFPTALQSDRVVVIHFTPPTYHVFSRTMFEDDESWRRFRALVRRQLMGCEQCGYTLKGSVADTCPECGHPIA